MSIPELDRSESAASLDLSPEFLGNQKVLKERARYYAAIGQPELGRRLLETAIRNGGWLKAGLWWELVATMRSSEDFGNVRFLWLSSPPECHDQVSILRAVARAACMADFHEESRALLRKAILLTATARPSRLIPLNGSRRLLAGARALFGRGTSAGSQGDDAPAAASEDTQFAKDASEALSDLNEAFASLGLKAFLISGTLLGLMREGRVLGWDKDIDVGVFSEDCPDDLEMFFRERAGFRVGRVDLTSDRLRVIHDNGTWIDVFPHYMEGDKRWHDGSATRWWNTPFGLKTMRFLDVDQHVPDDPERYLRENYGDWETPVRDFDARIDAPNVEVTDREHFKTLLFFSLENSIRKNKPAMTRRYVELLKEQGEGSWLDRL